MPDHLRTNKLAVAIRGNRMPVTLSTYSYELLLNFLQASRLVLILGIVNDHLSVKVRPRFTISSPKLREENVHSGRLDG